MPKPLTTTRGKSRADSLMETLKRKQLSAPAETAEPTETPPAAIGTQREPAAARPGGTPGGKRSAIYLNAEDQKILRELALWFASQGRPINDTLIIRAALRSVAGRPDNALLRAYEQARKADRRFKQAAEDGGGD